jgi:hypothetical protein
MRKITLLFMSMFFCFFLLFISFGFCNEMANFEKTISDNTGLFQAIIVIAFGIICWAFRNMLKEIKDSIADLYDKYNGQHGQLATLQGEHNAISEQHRTHFGQ